MSEYYLDMINEELQIFSIRRANKVEVFGGVGSLQVDVEYIPDLLNSETAALRAELEAAQEQIASLLKETGEAVRYANATKAENSRLQGLLDLRTEQYNNRASETDNLCSICGLFEALPDKAYCEIHASETDEN